MADNDLVLAITSEDRMVHTGTRAWLLEHVFGADTDGSGRRDLHGAAPTADDPGLEIYDDAGHALRVTDDGTALVAVGAGDADPDVLVARVASVLDRAREHLGNHPELGVPPSVVPWASGSLPEVLALLEGTGGTSRTVRHVPAAGLRGWLVELTTRVRLLVGRMPGTGGSGPVTGGGGPPLTPWVPPPLSPDGVPHNGSWFHNLMHRLTG
ncbi:hypothetical protein [Phycicoccus avicenniae]|uniref:hypothetical protein n=1 Tax=Phycicoccus avicenniae TaxID=2828860 RepID=UPI003D2B31C9